MEIIPPIQAAERHCGLGAVSGERHEAPAFAAGQHDGEDAGISSHTFIIIPSDGHHAARPG